MWVKRDNPVVDFTLLFSLLNLPFHEPSFVERNTDVETQVVSVIKDDTLGTDLPH